jgi:hypothetical protein
MSTKQPGWEGTFLAFAIIFTVLLGAAYGVAATYRTRIPWLIILVVAMLCALGLRYIRRWPGR